MAASVSHRAKYVGETKKLLRDGFGTYRYENQFFRYEGQWRNGKKHGHGKLIMNDGTFYEGQFVDGEIQGHGYKYFATSGSKFTGNFERGELHGYGIMQYTDGTMFEGEWAHNRKQGFGVLKTKDNSTYEGEFVGSMKHGEGTMYYGNGDWYNGNWVMDKKQGHGELHCMDGTHYEGQWFNDMFHGEGKMKHASGIIYEGQWLNGYPVDMATKMTIVMETNPLELQIGETFSIRVECRNDGDDLVKDQGRELQVTAGFKHYPTKAGSALFDMIEDVEEKPIETPFGYSMVSYPLFDHLAKEEEEEEKPKEETEEIEEDQEAVSKPVDGEEESTELEEEGKEESNDATENEKGEEKYEAESTDEKVVEQEGSRPTSPSQENVADTKTDTVTEPAAPAPEDTPLPPSVASQRTVDGVCDWGCLQLAPPPPMYRPFLAIEEEAGQKKKSKKLTASKSGEKADGRQSKREVKEKASTESVIDEVVARPGEYVIMVQDTTTPPFFGRVLPPAFALINVLKPKPKKKEVKPKWDTQKHIAAAMLRQAE